MLKSDSDEIENVEIVKAVENILALLPGPDDLGVTKHPELMRHRRLIHVEDAGKITDTQFRPVEGIENPYPGVIAKNLEELSKTLLQLCVWHLRFDLMNQFRMKTVCRAAF